MTQDCINEYRVYFSCKLVNLAAKYDKMLCMGINTQVIRDKIIFIRNLLTVLCIILDSNCYDILIAEKIVIKINTLLN
jgi:hypothetical protein